MSPLEQVIPAGARITCHGAPWQVEGFMPSERAFYFRCRWLAHDVWAWQATSGDGGPWERVQHGCAKLGIGQTLDAAVAVTVFGGRNSMPLVFPDGSPIPSGGSLHLAHADPFDEESVARAFALLYSTTAEWERRELA